MIEHKDRVDLLKSPFLSVRSFTEQIVSPLETEDFVIQAMEDVSPAKWHLGHTTWFFEAFILIPYDSSYTAFHPQFDLLFNSYYVTHSRPFARADRGVISRPTVEEIMSYRQYVEDHLLNLLDQADVSLLQKIYPIIEVGIHHEQQHQELLFMDIQYNLSCNPLMPVYSSPTPHASRAAPNQKWIHFEEGMKLIGHENKTFSYDNERPRHKVWLHDYSLASRPVTNGEYIDFMQDGGYQTAKYWLSDGWNIVNERGWNSPLYWKKKDEEWYHFTLSGFRKVNTSEPVCHISYYEADAFARWAGNRLPTEQEWENAFSHTSIKGNFAESELYRPSADYQDDEHELAKGFGDVWEWTMSPYTPYPGHKPYEGVLGEYNAKFMSNQMVLRGGSCVTPASHMRSTYRNFFHPDRRWQFSGLRLAGDFQ